MKPIMYQRGEPMGERISFNEEILRQINGSVDLASNETDVTSEKEAVAAQYGNVNVIVSKFAYICGVEDKFLTQFSKEIIDELKEDEKIRRFRAYTALRAYLMKHHSRIINEMTSGKALYNLLPEEDVKLIHEANAFDIYKNWRNTINLFIELNRQISLHAIDCKNLFPENVDWDYIRELLVMPKGHEKKGVQSAESIYRVNSLKYPFQTYINWIPQDKGNILVNDEKFVKIVYALHNEEFTDLHAVADLGSGIKTDIKNYIKNAKRLIFAVDCENTDPYEVCNAISSLDDEYREKITKVMLYDDTHTPETWKELGETLDVPVDYIMTSRLLPQKSTTDIRLASEITKAHYKNNVDSIVLVSSDSDYCAVMETMEDANFLVMAQEEKMSNATKQYLSERNIPYCFLEDFYGTNGFEFKKKVLYKHLKTEIARSVQLNLWSMLESVLSETMIQLSQTERKNVEKSLEKIHAVVQSDGEVVLEI